MVEQSYEEEDVLQDLLAKHPRSLESVAKGSDANRCLLIGRAPGSAGLGRQSDKKTARMLALDPQSRKSVGYYRTWG